MTFYDASTALIVAAHQPALVLELLRARDADAPQWLQGTGMESWAARQVAGAYSGPPGAVPPITPRQYLRLLAHAARALDTPETAFVLGRQLLPGHYGAASHALLRAASLRQAAELLVRHAPRLSPLLVPHWVVEKELAVLYWTSACGLGAQRGFVVEMQMAAVAAMCRWHSGGALPWTFCFNRTPPRQTEQLEVHLGSALRFNCQLDAMLIDAAWLDRPWPQGHGTVGTQVEVQAAVLAGTQRHTEAATQASIAARRAADQAAEHEALPPSLLAALYALLLAHVRQAPTLEDCSRHFGISPATLKRRLAQEGTHFQAELDQVRSHVALQLMHFRGMDNTAVAAWLGFHDAANFRRSFKRWTGSTPSLLRLGLARSV
ncbi:MAG: AraC family transcriptional regulator ligand-binding domain-containing protein [Rubrivivax sp.]|nr:AraC family transcriptional regulator ligand-binding domain-containing protein [Rubrivivax sp.]